MPTYPLDNMCFHHLVFFEIFLMIFIVVSDQILFILPFFDTFRGPNSFIQGASNWGFCVFVGFFRFVIVSYLLIYAPNQKIELTTSVSLVSFQLVVTFRVMREFSKRSNFLKSQISKISYNSQKRLNFHYNNQDGQGIKYQLVYALNQYMLVILTTRGDGQVRLEQWCWILEHL